LADDRILHQAAAAVGISVQQFVGAGAVLYGRALLAEPGSEAADVLLPAPTLERAGVGDTRAALHRAFAALVQLALVCEELRAGVAEAEAGGDGARAARLAEMAETLTGAIAERAGDRWVLVARDGSRSSPGPMHRPPVREDATR
jgi:hypothetical protein